MFAKRLRVLLNYQTRVTCSKFHSNGHLSKVNLTSQYHQLKRNDVYSKNALLPIYTVRLHSDISLKEDHEVDEDEIIGEFGLVEDEKLTENGYMYEILRRSGKYKTLMPPIIPDKDVPDNVVEEILAKNYEDFSVTELIEDFKTISCHAKLNSIKPSKKSHGKLFGLMEKYISDMMDEQLWDVLNHVPLWYPITAAECPESFSRLQLAFDRSLYDRINDFSPDEMLKSCDLMFHLRRPRLSQFITRVIVKLGSKPGKMSPTNYVHFMFIVNIARRSPMNMYELEYALEPMIHMYDTNELGVIAAAFFKTKTPLRNMALVDKIIEKCTADMASMGQITLSAVMKALRLSLVMKKDLSGVTKMLKAFESRLDRTSVSTLVHASHLAASVLLPTQKTIDKIFEKFQGLVQTARVKDLERMLFVLNIYNKPKDHPMYEVILEEMRNPERQSEYIKYYQAFSASLMYLACAGIFPLDIIEKVMDHDYLKEVYKNNPFKIGQSYLNLELSLQIEVPEYKGPTLPTKIRNYLIKKKSAEFSYNRNPEVKEQYYQRTLFDISNNAKEVLRTDKLRIEQLLPHFERADIIYCLNTNDNTIAEQFMSANLVGPIKYAPTVPAGYKWIAIVIVPYNQVLRTTTVIAGILNTKMRQLQKIGYTPAPVISPVWRELLTSQSKKEYLHTVFSKINTAKIEGDIKNV